jgi:hypothetical protein
MMNKSLTSRTCDTECISFGMQSHSRSFLLRLWQVQSEGGWKWFYSLENPMTGERIGFKDLRLLYGKLEQICQQVERSEQNDPSKYSRNA